MEDTGGPCSSRLTADAEPGPLEPALDCAADGLKALSPAQLHGFLLASPPLGVKRQELELADVAYLDSDALPLQLAPSAALNCSILMGYLRKADETAKPLPPPSQKRPPEQEPRAQTQLQLGTEPEPGPADVSAPARLPQLPRLAGHH
ncbi:uncharacterized protein LOC119100375 [Pollicipes pollicipes]|uniref:uncharacterized protein LOC119100375 n=1 Tax=Pollicipes pollicipes TaxID=41117 RepID=UPI0018856318|nr:uncharacterized protein LOC119100375 [Pollicipes pollicipes]